MCVRLWILANDFDDVDYVSVSGFDLNVDSLVYCRDNQIEVFIDTGDRWVEGLVTDLTDDHVRISTPVNEGKVLHSVIELMQVSFLSYTTRFNLNKMVKNED